MCHPNTITRLGAAFIRFVSSWFPQTKQAWIQSDNLILSCRRLWFYCLQIRSPANYHNSFIAICSNHVLQSNVRMNINLSPSVWRWNPHLLYERLHCFGPSCTRWRLQLLVVLLSITSPPRRTMRLFWFNLPLDVVEKQEMALLSHAAYTQTKCQSFKTLLSLSQYLTLQKKVLCVMQPRHEHRWQLR